jgi:leucine dehydrogenase
MALKITHEAQKGYERVVSFTDDSGFQCFIAVHNTVLGKALGGCRIKPYASSDEALIDVMRLSKGMTYKSSLAGLNFGGGKCVVNAERATREIMLKVGECVEYFDGLYVTAEDVGTTLDDIRIVGEVTPHIVHLDGSSMTARGVLACMQAAVKWQGYWGDDLDGMAIWVQGLGKVGMDLVKRLVALEPGPGLNLYVNDLRPEMVAEAEQLGAREVSDNDKRFMAIYAPCAMGQVINADNVNTVRYSIICGSANNQLTHDEYAEVLQTRDVMYVPDFLANAGGVINAAYEIGQEFDQAKCEEHTDCLGEILVSVFDQARREKITPLAMALRRAEERFTS